MDNKPEEVIDNSVAAGKAGDSEATDCPDIDWEKVGEEQVRALLLFDATSPIFRGHPKIIGGRLIMGEY